MENGSQLDNAAIQTLKSMYMIETSPSVVIDGEKLEGLSDKDLLLEKINCDEECIADATENEEQ